LPQRVPRDGRTVVVTVAHGEVSMAALRFARKHKLPLVTFFHDWWPDIPVMHPPAKWLLERNFRRLYHYSSAALCVCGGMKTALGAHCQAPVLYPIPAPPRTLKSEAQNNEGTRPFTLIYSGNLNGSYGEALRRILEALDNHLNIRLEVRGTNPPWPDMFKAEMRDRGQWLPFAPRDELDAWLSTADAFLVPMGFEPHLRLRMETSFPSKIPEFTQFGKPLVIWGPEYCSAVQWARQGNRALCVTDPNPVALCQALEKLTESPDEQQRLATTARHAAQTDFSPDKIHAQFMEALRGVVKQTLTMPEVSIITAVHNREPSVAEAPTNIQVL